MVGSFTIETVETPLGRERSNGNYLSLCVEWTGPSFYNYQLRKNGLVMAYQVLARKWRPKKFEDVIGQHHITKSLQNILRQNTYGQVYLFTGTRGTGKTSVARIFAKALRCESNDINSNPCGTCNLCKDFDTGNSIDVLEIDGASNNGVDHIRNLIDEIYYTPSSGKFKIYIIDEVHMVTVQGFNALLKTLEEPPEHAIFILATTDPEKIPDTVLSRCQRFDFRHVGIYDLQNQIQKISNSEGIVFERTDIIKQLCILGKGSVRDTLSLLDQVLSLSDDKKITEEMIVSALGLARLGSIQKLLQSIIFGNSKDVSKYYRLMLAENVEVKNLILITLDQLYEIILFKTKAEVKDGQLFVSQMAESLTNAEAFWIYETLVKDFDWALKSVDPEKVVEIILQKIAARKSFFKKMQDEKNQAPVEAIQSYDDLKKKENENLKDVLEEIVKEKKEIVLEDNFSQDLSGEKSWGGFLAYFRKISPAAAANLEQGNIISDPVFLKKPIFIKLAFSYSCKLFYDHLTTSDVKNKLLDNLEKYLQLPKEEFSLELVLLDDQQKHSLNFESIAEIKLKDEENSKEQEKKSIEDHLLIKEAEKIFNAKIDKIILNKK